MSKGSAFEREVCKKLSLWWTDGKDDAVFYRTHASGGRATSRSKRGKKTENSHGDVMAVDVVGLPFLKLCSVEIKRGYSKNTIQDLLDKPKRAAIQVYEEWFAQAAKSQEESGSLSWCVITKRDKRETLILMSSLVLGVLSKYEPSWSCSTMDLNVDLEGGIVQIKAVPLSSFFDCVKPSWIKEWEKLDKC